MGRGHGSYMLSVCLKWTHDKRQAGTGQLSEWSWDKKYVVYMENAVNSVVTKMN